MQAGQDLTVTFIRRDGGNSPQGKEQQDPLRTDHQPGNKDRITTSLKPS
jgi:hypothetical protein